MNSGTNVSNQKKGLEILQACPGASIQAVPPDSPPAAGTKAARFPAAPPTQNVGGIGSISLA